jgi:uncharacterized membrane protein
VLELIRLEDRESVRTPRSDRLADQITAAAGSVLYVGLHVVWFGAWLVLGPVLGFDGYPFGLLTTIVSIEAIFLALFVLRSQKRQAMLAEKRAKLDLQINVITEREVTKLIEMVDRIQRHLGLEGRDPEATGMQKRTRIRPLADGIEKAKDKIVPKSAKEAKTASAGKA